MCLLHSQFLGMRQEAELADLALWSVCYALEAVDTLTRAVAPLPRAAAPAVAAAFYDLLPLLSAMGMRNFGASCID